MSVKPEIESSANWEAQMLQATRIAHDVSDILRDEFLTVDLCREFVMKIFMPGRESDVILRRLGAMEREDMQPFDEPGFMRTFRELAVQQYQIFGMRQVNLTGVGLATFTGNKGRTPRSIMVDELFLIGCHPGSTGIIYGVPGSGKTNLAVAEIYRVATQMEHTEIDCNIPIKDMPDNAKYNGTLSGTLLHGAEFSRDMISQGYNDSLVVWINDEAQVSRSRKTSMKGDNMAMEQISMLSRKLSFFQWSILQQNKPTSEVKAFATHFIEKPDRTRPGNCDLKITGPYEITQKLSGLPSAEDRGIEYDSRSMLTYTVDMNPLKMLAWVVMTLDKNGYIKTTAQFDAIVQYIKNHQGESLGSEMLTDDVMATLMYRIRERLKNTEDKGMVTYDKIGKMCGWSLSKARNKIEEVAKQESEGRKAPTDPDELVDDWVKDMGGVTKDEDEGVTDENE